MTKAPKGRKNFPRGQVATELIVAASRKRSLSSKPLGGAVRKSLISIGVMLALFLPSVAVFAETETIDLKALARKARPAVMLVVVSDAKGDEIATGTGFLVSSDGRLFTNFHVIEKAASAVVKAESGGIFPVEGVLAADPKSDLVLLKIKGKDLPFLTLAAGDKIEAGTRVAVIGSPLGFEGTLSEGIVSAVRELMSETRMLQITAAISPGSSGSPVLNGNGEVLGVATLFMRGGQALNFAVPCEVARTLQAKAVKSPTLQPFSAVIVSEKDKIVSDPEWRAACAAEFAQDYVEMLKHSQALVRRYPNSSWAHSYLGLAYDYLKFTTDAIAAYQQAIKLKPDDATLWDSLGSDYLQAGRTADAIVAYQQAIKLKPDYAQAWYNLGVTYGKAGRADDKITAYQQAIKLRPDYAKAWYNLGVTYDADGRTADAIAAYQQVIKLKPDTLSACLGLGDISDYFSACLGLGDIYLGAGRTADAIAAYQQATKLKPDSAITWYSLALAYKSNRQMDKALDALRQLEKLDLTTAQKLRSLLERPNR